MTSGNPGAGAPTLLRPESVDDLMAVLVEIVGELDRLQREVATLRGDAPDTDRQRLDTLIGRVFATFAQGPVVPEAEPA